MSTRRKPQRSGYRARSTGVVLDATGRTHAQIDRPRRGEHLWAAFAVYRLASPTAEQVYLDTENLLTIEGPGCFVCELPYTPELATRPCTGDPDSVMLRGGSDG